MTRADVIRAAGRALAASAAGIGASWWAGPVSAQTPPSSVPDALDPQGPKSATIASVWTILLVFALVVFVVVTAFIVVAALNGRRTSEEHARRRDPATEVVGLDVHRFIALGGVIVPTVILVVVGVVTVKATGDVRTGAPDAVHVQVEGVDWFWEVRYPDLGVETANEVHVPVGRPVEVDLVTRDVIHSFWVPQLAGKKDMIPGQPSQLAFTADHPGIYRGQCAEFCGIQHANMAFFVVAQPAAEFDAWVAGHRGPVAAPTGQAAEGQAVFERQACAGCHHIRGTTAEGRLGPDLSDVGERQTLGAGAVSNTPDNLGRFIVQAQAVKPGNAMPNLQLSPADVDALVAYLEGLK